MANKKEVLLEVSTEIPSTALSGTVDGNSNTINGDMDTLFLTELSVGDIITVLGNTGIYYRYTVANIVSDSQLQIVGQVYANITAGSLIYKSTISCPYFIQTDPAFGGYIGFKSPVYGTGYFNALAPNGSGLFERREGILINSIYMRLPYQYTMADTAFIIDLFYVNEAGNTYQSIDVFGVNGRAPIPYENSEIPINVYVPPPPDSFSGNDTKYGIAFKINGRQSQAVLAPSGTMPDALNTQAWVSILETPDSMIGQLLPITLGLRATYGLSVT